MTDLHPLIAQGISVLLGAIAAAIVAYSSYKWPKGHDRFDEDDEDGKDADAT